MPMFLHRYSIGNGRPKSSWYVRKRGTKYFGIGQISRVRYILCKEGKKYFHNKEY